MAYDIWGFLGAAPHWTVYLAALIGLLLGGWWLNRVTNQINSMMSTIESLDTMRVNIDEHVKDANNHYKDVAHIASEEHWKNCDITKCIHLQQITNRLDQFDRRADETRQNTTISLQGLRNSQERLSKDMGKEVADLAKLLVNVLNENMKRR